MSQWQELLAESDIVTNVTIVCQDNIVQTHKIIVASASELLKDLINEYPPGDKVVIFMPEFRTHQIKNLINKLMFPIIQIDCDVSEALNIGKSNYQTAKVKVEDKTFIDINELCEDTEETEKSVSNSESEEEDERDTEIGDIKKKIKLSNDSKELENISSFEYNQTYKEIHEEIRKLKDMIISEPSSQKEKGRNAQIKRRIIHEKAKADVVGGICNSVRAAAIKYKLSDSTLGKFIKGGPNAPTFFRKKNILQFLDFDEELDVLNR